MEKTQNTEETNTSPAVQTKKPDILDVQYKNDKEFSKLLEKVAGSSETARELVHQAAIQAFIQAMEKDNFDRSNQLVTVVKEKLSSYAAGQLIKWFASVGPFGWRKTEQETAFGGYKFRKSKSKDAAPWNLDKALSEPWYEFDKEATNRIVKFFGSDSVFARIDKLVQSLESAVQEGKYANPALDAQVFPLMIEDLKMIKSKFEGEVNALTVAPAKVGDKGGPSPRSNDKNDEQKAA